MHTHLRLLVAVLVACAAVAGLVGEPLSASPPRSLTFEVLVDERLEGGHWTLTTTTGPSQLETLLLGTGAVDGVAEPVQASVPVVDAARSTSRQFVLRFHKRLDDSHALVATASAGLLSRDVLKGGVVDLGKRDALVSRTHATAAEALAASSCSTSCSPAPSGGSSLGPGSSLAYLPSGGVPAADFRSTAERRFGHNATRGGAVTAQAQGERPAAPGPPHLSCDNPFDLCGGPPVPSVDGRGCDTTGFVTTECVVESYDISGVFAFRGNSYRPVGARSSFSVSEAAVQRWENGYRVELGPFQVEGHTEREVGVGSTTVWPRRNDCWSPARPNDGPTCDPWGAIWSYGRDSWRWQKVLVHRCFFSPFPGPPACDYDTEERLFQLSYDGGTEAVIDWEHFDDGWFESRSAILASGSAFAPYMPDSQSTWYQEDKVTEGAGAAIRIEFPESLGGAEFRSSVENQVLNRVGNHHHLRPTTELPFLAWFYRYDWNYDHFQYDFWSCEFAPGNTGGPCTLSGT